MMQRIGARISKWQRFLPLTATILLFFIAYLAGMASFAPMRDSQVFFTLFITTPFLLVSTIGETFVIISGGIDLSVSGMIALTTTAAAALIRGGSNPWWVMVLMLLMGMALGTIMGLLITYLKVQPFIATLAGMWFSRGMCYLISDAEIRIHNATYTLLSGTKLLIPGLADPVTQKGDYVSILVVVALVIFVISIYIAHFTPFGRTIYSMGGANGANEQSARLMGLPVDRTKVLVYTFSGLCSAIAGIIYSIYVGSGHGTHASNGYEMTVIAAVVIGGTMLTGGVGYVFGSLFGVLITALIQSLIQFNGKLNSWWASIAIGALTLVFIGVQSFVANINTRQLAAGRKAKEGAQAAGIRKRRLALFGGGAVVVVVLAVIAYNVVPHISLFQTPASTACELKPLRQDQVQELVKGGAVIVYERNGGTECIDELYAIYPDGRITGDNGAQQITGQVTPAEVERLLESINNMQWFTDNIYSTHHVPCGACYTYFLDVVYKGQEKNVQAVDGGIDAPDNYWQITALLTLILPKFPAP
jgi:ribose/xylose/arabinose/galactoside ABC-type transport system permease subunit